MKIKSAPRNTSETSCVCSLVKIQPRSAAPERFQASQLRGQENRLHQEAIRTLRNSILLADFDRESQITAGRAQSDRKRGAAANRMESPPDFSRVETEFFRSISLSNTFENYANAISIRTK